MPKTIVIATNNQGKVTELRKMLSELPIELVSLADFPELGEIDETGASFAENARLKAAGYARATGITALADDSGLEIAALGGRPGVHSARYGGSGADFAQKMALLLSELGETPAPERTARFVCSMAIADAGGNILCAAEGICSGQIAFEPSGSGGFGYDPIFMPDGYERSFGELSPDIKHEISHRSRAFRVIIPFLRHFIAD